VRVGRPPLLFRPQALSRPVGAPPDRRAAAKPVTAQLSCRSTVPSVTNEAPPVSTRIYSSHSQRRANSGRDRRVYAIPFDHRAGVTFGAWYEADQHHHGADTGIHQMYRGTKQSAAHYLRMILANDDHTHHARRSRTYQRLTATRQQAAKRNVAAVQIRDMSSNYERADQL